MEKCNIFLVDLDGVKRPYGVNLNQNFNSFLRTMSELDGIEYTSISLSGQIYGQGEYEFSLKQLGFRPGVDVELMSSLKPSIARSSEINGDCKIFIVDSTGSINPYQVNLSMKLGEFIKRLSNTSRIQCTAVSFGDRIYGQDFYEYRLREIGIRQGVEIELISTFKGGR